MKQWLCSALAAILAVLLAASPARADWLRAESPNFVVYSESGEARVREQVAQLEGFDRLLRMLTGLGEASAPNKLDVYFVRGHAQLARISARPAGVAGFYRATADGIIAVVDETVNRGENNNDILFHEYAHHFMMQYASAAYPAWYIEGFAEYVATAEIAPQRLTIGNYNRMRATWLADRMAWLPFETIVRGLPARADENMRARFYAQSWLLVHYLSATEERRQGLRRYFAALRERREPVQAFQAVFGMDMRALDRALRTYANGFTYSRIERAAGEAAPAVTIVPLPEMSDTLILAQAALRAGIDSPERRRELLGDLRRTAAREPSPTARRVLAQAEVLYGDPAAAEPVLDALIAQAPQDAELLYLRGLRHLRAGREDERVRQDQYRAARAWFARAHRADPHHYQTLFRYAESYTVEPGYVSENIQEILLLATELAPQVADIRLAAAEMLLLRDRFAEAEALLAPIVSSAHGGSSATEAARLLGLARAHERPVRQPAPTAGNQPAPAGE